MANCPVCQSAIDDDFGLVNCASCGAQVFLDFDGKVSKAQEDIAPVSDGPPAMLLPEVPPPLAAELSQVLVNDMTAEDNEPTRAAFDGAEEILTAVAPAPKPAASADMTEIADFGNSSISQGREGLLRFDIRIAGIDTADVREEVREIITDAKFLWDAEKLIGQVKDGELNLKGLTAVKAALLLQRLRTVAVEVSWEQHAIHQA